MHQHLCPCQVLGVLMGVRAGLELGIRLPQADKRLIAFVETGEWDRRRHGLLGRPQDEIHLRFWQGGRDHRRRPDRATDPDPATSDRSLAGDHAPEVEDPWARPQAAHQVMPDEDLLSRQPVELDLDLAALISGPGGAVDLRRGS